MGQIQLTISLVLIGLFAIAIIGFAINFAEDNNAPIDISNDLEITLLNTQSSSNLEEYESDSESQYTSILETTIEGEVAPSTGPFAVTPTNAIGTVENILEVGYIKIFGTGAGFGIFLTSLISIILFMIGLYIYKTLRGLPD